MSQSTVTVQINGQTYQMGCDAGQERHIEEMGKNVDSIVQQLVSSVGQIGDARLLAMASLILSDQVQAANKQISSSSKEFSNTDDVSFPAVGSDDIMLTKQQMENLVDQIKTMALTIENLAQTGDKG